MESENVAITILSILALVIALVAIGYVFLDQPEKVDLSEALTGITGNTLLINALQRDVSDIEDDVTVISWSEVTQDDLDDLEDDLERYARNRAGDDGKDGADGTDGTNGTYGVDGINGTSCSVEQLEDGCAIISCTDETSVTICEVGPEGQQGEQGIQGETGEDGQDGLLNQDEYNCLVDANNYTEFRLCLENLEVI